MEKKLDPWSSEAIKDYEQIFKNFGIEHFKPLLKKLKNPHMLMRRGVVIGHRDFRRIADSINNKKEYVMMTGLMPTGQFHFGHKMLADQIIWYQENNAQVFVGVADLEAYGVRKIPLEQLRKTAMNEYIANYIALGLKKKNARVFFQSDYNKEYYKFKSMLARRATMNEFKAIYGDSVDSAKITAVLHQVADILHPELPQWNGKKPVVVPVGIDQDPHIRITRDMASRVSEYEFIAPSSTYHVFQTGLDGGKMSSSNPLSYIALSEDSESADKKLKNALTGGKDTVEEQKKQGGNPEKCVIFEFYKYHLIQDDKKLEKIYNDCKAGKLLCGDDKANACKLLKKFLDEHQKKLAKAKDKVNDYIVSE